MIAIHEIANLIIPDLIDKFGSEFSKRGFVYDGYDKIPNSNYIGIYRKSWNYIHFMKYIYSNVWRSCIQFTICIHPVVEGQSILIDDFVIHCGVYEEKYVLNTWDSDIGHFFYNGVDIYNGIEYGKMIDKIPELTNIIFQKLNEFIDKYKEIINVYNINLENIDCGDGQ